MIVQRYLDGVLTYPLLLMLRFPWLPVLLLWAVPVFAQPVSSHRDARIDHLLARVSADSIEATIRKLASFGTRHTLSDTTSETVGIGAARRWMKHMLERFAAVGGGRMEVYFDSFVYAADSARVDRAVMLKNVVARLPGSDSSDTRVFIVSGHYDSRASDIMDSTSAAPGASDDASGTAVVMEMARVMADAQFPATLLLVGVAGEEQGLLGARHLADTADSLGWNVAGMITLDIVGNTMGGDGTKDNRTLRVFSEGVSSAETELEARIRRSIGGENDSPSRQFARYVEEIGERYQPRMDVKMIFRRDRFLRGGDHIPFLEHGFPAVRLTEPNEAFTRQHQDLRTEDGIAYGDVPEAVDFDYVADVTRLTLATITNLALAPPAPINVGIEARSLSADTKLVWSHPAAGEKRRVGYVVLVRETTAPRWERKLFVGNVTEYTLEGFSKDDYFFAVQAVDQDGHESRIIFPRPNFR